MTMAAVVLLSLIWTVGPWLETRVWPGPVVAKLKILKIEMLTLEKSLVYAEFEKLRDCDYDGIAWYKGKRDGVFDRVLIVTRRDPADISSPNRPLGLQRAGPWEVALTREEILTNSFAELRHKCWPFWSTTTPFYP